MLQALWLSRISTVFNKHVINILIITMDYGIWDRAYIQCVVVHIKSAVPH